MARELHASCTRASRVQLACNSMQLPTSKLNVNSNCSRYGGAPHCFLERHASQECPACKHEEIKRTMRGTHDGMVKSCTTRAKQRCLPDRLRASVSQARRLLIEWGGVPSNTCRYCCYCQVRLLLLLLGGVVLCCAMLCYVLVIVMTIQFDSAQFNSTQLNSIQFTSTQFNSIQFQLDSTQLN